MLLGIFGNYKKHLIPVFNQKEEFTGTDYIPVPFSISHYSTTIEFRIQRPKIFIYLVFHYCRIRNR